MKTKLIEEILDELLKKFGAGKHKPGSGSAAALTCLLSAHLNVTVAEVTLGKNMYSNFHSDCNFIKSHLKDDLIKRLEILFQEDSERFDSVHKLREARDKEQNQANKNSLNSQIQKKLVRCTEIPAEIAEVAAEIADQAISVFDNGAWWVRGDSQVAISNAISAISGCLSIINLNLSFFPLNEWVAEMIIKRDHLKAEYKRLQKANDERLEMMDTFAERNNQLKYKIDQLKGALLYKKYLNNNEIEELARNMLLTMHKYQDVIWKDGRSRSPLETIDATKLLKLLEYDCKDISSCGTNEHNEEIAGIINKDNYTVRLSKQYPKEVRNFTRSHELGHALLHTEVIQHRDRPYYMVCNKHGRVSAEYQADKFASYFLMPKKVMKSIFIRTFGTDSLVLNEETAYAVTNSSLGTLNKKVHNLRDWSRIVASSVMYNSSPIISMTSVFNISVEAMAIRLEELQLIII
ncbi:MAG: formiminotetrahydrofolate cyclodeaminase/Zn-dependent peptidase ImmA (M78 family) [Halioglobus sp.]|jgi:formiminotetrahydrofolate cyclodeaminase/Zn-dependent peptidase ImmA (M78 family)